MKLKSLRGKCKCDPYIGGLFLGCERDFLGENAPSPLLSAGSSLLTLITGDAAMSLFTTAKKKSGDFSA